MNVSSNPLVSVINYLYALLVTVGNHLQSPFLFFIRFVWGIQLMQAGVGKLFNISLPTGYFMQLGIPFPEANAWLVAFTETFGGIFLAFGLLTRLTAVPLIINFIVAYITTEQKGLHELLGFDTSDFAADTAFPYFATAIIVLIFGPGIYSVDGLLARWRKQPWRGPEV
jgi:putative oxidoreductase